MPTWRAIENAKKLIVKGACYLIGDGATINVWEDPWVPWIQGFKPQPRNENITQCPIMVSQLIDHTTHSWIPSLVTELFDAASAQAIMLIPIPYSPRQDKLMWTPSSKGVFSVKSAY